MTDRLDLKNHLPSAQLEKIVSLGNAADGESRRAVVVGGCVRDLILSRPTFDIDLMLEHPVAPFLDQWAKQQSATVTSHERFLTFSVAFSSGMKFDVVTAREEIYEAPAKLPTVKPSTIEKDLRRRDFTVNAIASFIHSARLGELLDPYGGRRDIDKKLIRVLHQKSFVDDPTRIYRAARFCARFDFVLESETESVLRAAIEQKLPQLLSPVRRRHEFELILKEERPEKALRLLEDWNALRFIHPEWKVVPDHQFSSEKLKSTLDERLAAWLRPWGKLKAQAMLDELAFERRTKKAVLDLLS